MTGSLSTKTGTSPRGFNFHKSSWFSRAKPSMASNESLLCSSASATLRAKGLNQLVSNFMMISQSLRRAFDQADFCNGLLAEYSGRLFIRSSTNWFNRR